LAGEPGIVGRSCGANWYSGAADARWGKSLIAYGRQARTVA